MLNIPFTNSLFHFSPDVTEYVCDLIKSNFNKFRPTSNNQEENPEHQLHEQFVETILVSLPMNAVSSNSDISALVDALSVLMNSNNASNSTKQAAVYALGFSNADNALSTLLSIIKFTITDLSSNSHGYSDEIMSSTISSYCYSASNKNYDIYQNGEIETLLKLLQHSSATISIATRHGLGRLLDITSLMKVFQSN
ncbi:unnamed protein product [Rotaria socialis]|uniref:Uncharacterized protein n=1 Tax=Rotaria socialis TaxID=392032 RepID=A0A821RF94_9BILA|nr:unnamed protein product [Rotaria socialis]CAF4840778.1 unnamed protein product [Rotaria socialis]